MIKYTPIYKHLFNTVIYQLKYLHIVVSEQQVLYLAPLMSILLHMLTFMPTNDEC